MKKRASKPELEHEDAGSRWQQSLVSDSNDSKISNSDHEHAGQNRSHLKQSRNWQGHWPKTPGRLLGIGIIRLYQLTLSGFIGNSCRHLPTCSEYGYEAIARHGLLKGGWLTIIRVAKCNPFGTSGHDPVPKGKNAD